MMQANSKDCGHLALHNLMLRHMIAPCQAMFQCEYNPTVKYGYIRCCNGKHSVEHLQVCLLAPVLRQVQYILLLQVPVYETSAKVRLALNSISRCRIAFDITIGIMQVPCVTKCTPFQYLQTFNSFSKIKCKLPPHSSTTGKKHAKHVEWSAGLQE